MDWEVALDVFVHGAADGPDGEYEPPAIPNVVGLEGIIENSICSNPFEKQLTNTDLTQPELFLSKSDVEEHLLPLLNGDEDISKGIQVTTYNMDGKEYGHMVLRFKPRKNYYVLANKGWTQFREGNELQVEDFVTMWMFRHVVTTKLCFVIAKSAIFIREEN